MKEDFVTYGLAVKLKEKGFKEECIAHYFNGEFIYNISQFRGACVESLLVSYNSLSQTDNIYENYNKCIDAPSVSQVLKWLRDEKKLYLSIEPYLTDFSSTEIMWIWDALYINSDCKFKWHDGEFGFDSYEKAAVSAIEDVIDNLI